MPTSSRQPTSLVPGYRPGYCSTMTPASEAWRLLWCWNRMGRGNTTETAHRQSCLNMSSKLCVAKQCPSQCLKWGKGFLPWCRPVRVHTLAEDSQYKFFLKEYGYGIIYIIYGEKETIIPSNKSSCTFPCPLTLQGPFGPTTTAIHCHQTKP